MPNWATTGFVLASSRIASNRASPPVVVPPGLLTNRMTAATCLFSASRFSSLSWSRSSVMMPSRLTRAICRRSAEADAFGRREDDERRRRGAPASTASAAPQRRGAGAGGGDRGRFRSRMSCGSASRSGLCSVRWPGCASGKPTSRRAQPGRVCAAWRFAPPARQRLACPAGTSDQLCAVLCRPSFFSSAPSFFLMAALKMSPSEAPRVGGAVLRHGLLLLGDLQRLDRHRDAAAVLVEAGDGGIDLVADVEALGPLLGAVARQVGALDEGGDVAVGDLDLDAVLLHRQHLAGDLAALLAACRCVSSGSPPTCLMPRLMRSFCASTSSTTALTVSPFL